MTNIKRYHVYYHIVLQRYFAIIIISNRWTSNISFLSLHSGTQFHPILQNTDHLKLRIMRWVWFIVYHLLFITTMITTWTIPFIWVSAFLSMIFFIFCGVFTTLKERNVPMNVKNNFHSSHTISQEFTYYIHQWLLPTGSIS